MGEPKVWDKAEKELREILEKSGKDYFVLDGDGAFYGPKIDILMKDALGRDWQMGTLQLDFQIPQRFGLQYSDKDGSLKMPVVLHRVIYGSLERFIGLIIEHFAGAFPVWLSPIQIEIIPISEKHVDYAKKVAQTLKEKGLRVEINDKDSTMGAKIREAQNQKVPYMLIVGDKEIEANKVSVRLRTGEDLGGIDLAEVASKIQQKYLDKSLDLW